MQNNKKKILPVQFVMNLWMLKVFFVMETPLHPEEKKKKVQTSI